MAKFISKIWMSLFFIVLCVIIIISMTCRCTKIEGFDDKIGANPSTNSMSANVLINLINSLDAKTIAEFINSKADEVNTIIDNVDAYKLRDIMQNISQKVNNNYNMKSSQNIITNNSNIVNSSGGGMNSSPTTNMNNFDISNSSPMSNLNSLNMGGNAPSTNMNNLSGYVPIVNTSGSVPISF